MTNHPRTFPPERLAAYALGERDRELETHLSEGCDECEKTLAEFSETVVDLAYSAPAETPSPDLRARVLHAIAADSRGGVELRPPTETSSRFGAWAGWASAAVLAVVAFVGWQREFSTRATVSEYREQVATLQSEVSRLDIDVARLRLELVELGRGRAVLTASGLEFVTLTPTEEGRPAPGARVAFDPDLGRAIALFRDAAPPDGRDFQLWALRDDGSVRDLGVLRADAAGTHELPLDLADVAPSIQGFAISLEPAGGSPDSNGPSGPVVAVGLRG